ncbi:DUF2334 domain-containing protein [Virgisporangium aurantiacum]|uniref:DUF2334 domain-containing protein n=1 Tax=Virgisporangium aurantiacum TaxID=175570 RepID=A0A8J3ZGJ8_9ACTN|nr:polysaccharide deacetylase family protein [Virgisporangium aurantiacum]GIJ61470.1 hypothetical protein Vau01_089860 [Virgisporangium aurantiacum]
MNLRRTFAAALTAAAFIGGGAVIAPQGAMAAPGKVENHGDGHSADAQIPAPPSPVKKKPDQRVIAPGTASGRSSTNARSTAKAVTAIPNTVTGKAAPGGGTAKTLVLYDETGPYAWLGEVYAEQTANLVSHYGSWTVHPASGYQTGELAAYSAVVYVGSTYDEPLPVSFLDDVLGTSKPVLWMYDNIWQLSARAAATGADFATRYGYMWKQFDTSAVAEVRYDGQSLTRDTVNGSGIMDQTITDASKVTVLGDAVRPDGTTFPWALKSANLTYLGEIPYAYVTHDDRYLAFADLLTGVLAPSTAERHRALVRIEDVGPDADPAELRAVADLLSSKKVPFTVAVYTRYRDPKGALTGGKAEDYTLAKRPEVVKALKYMQQKGGTLLMHGYTHQLNAENNPYDGVSGNDFEFYRAHVDEADRVIYDGPVVGDSAAWATSRIAASKLEFARAGLTQPTIFEFPHYAGSAADYAAVNSLFGVRYERGLYFPGTLRGKAADYSHLSGQFFPYAVRDVYGSVVIPENIGNIEPEAYNTHPVRLPADLIASAKRNLVVRDGVASFFYHPYLGTAYLKQSVEGIQGLGYTFVAASAMTK